MLPGCTRFSALQPRKRKSGPTWVPTPHEKGVVDARSSPESIGVYTGDRRSPSPSGAAGGTYTDGSGYDRRRSMTRHGRHGQDQRPVIALPPVHFPVAWSWEIEQNTS